MAADCGDGDGLKRRRRRRESMGVDCGGWMWKNRSMETIREGYEKRSEEKR